MNSGGLKKTRSRDTVISKEFISMCSLKLRQKPENEDIIIICYGLTSAGAII